ncbi:GEVED domain-containing protein [Glycomyces sp. NPDC049804]|uniref:DUF7927 domain-containing protein n=1 Tax=Glycomyces sp. NPDC049804 TaxID=3154363 RepID=UPI0034397FD5
MAHTRRLRRAAAFCLVAAVAAMSFPLAAAAADGQVKTAWGSGGERLDSLATGERVLWTIDLPEAEGGGYREVSLTDELTDGLTYVDGSLGHPSALEGGFDGRVLRLGGGVPGSARSGLDRFDAEGRAALTVDPTDSYAPPSRADAVDGWDRVELRGGIDEAAITVKDAFGDSIPLAAGSGADGLDLSALGYPSHQADGRSYDTSVLTVTAEAEPGTEGALALYWRGDHPQVWYETEVRAESGKEGGRTEVAVGSARASGTTLIPVDSDDPEPERPATAAAPAANADEVVRAPEVKDPAACPNVISLENGSFESPPITTGTFQLFHESAVPGWSTTASDGQIEMWVDGYNGVPAADGDQFAELNANVPSALFQDLATTPGATMAWALKHRGRLGTDVMRLDIGAPGGPLVTQGEMSDGTDAWGAYSGVYTVPAGQTTTRFAFTAVAAAGGNDSFGNFLDDIEFGTEACVILDKGQTLSETPATIGSTVTYTVDATNGGGVGAQNLVLEDLIPAGTVFVPGSLTIDGAPQTDAAGDDQAEYDADANAVRYRLGADEGAGGVLHAGSTSTIGFTVKITAAGTVANTATADYREPVSGADKTSTSNTVEAVALEPLAIAKTADPTDPKPGDTVQYTVTVTNPNPVTYPGAAFEDDLTAVLDDAAYNLDATADHGATAYAEPVLSWSGDIPANQTATITYSVAIDEPLTGDGVLANAVTGGEDTNCPPGGTDPACASQNAVALLEFTKTADVNEAGAGDIVTYTITVANVGKAATTAAVTDDLSGVLDDATWRNDLAADAGEPAYTEPEVSWSGDLAAGATATITYSVQVNTPLSGDGSLGNAIVSETGNCKPGSADPDCSATVQLAGIRIEKAADKTQVYAGGVVTYTITVTNPGTATYRGAALTDDLSDVNDDAAYNGDAAADSGEVAYTEPTLSWSGDVAPGQTIAIRYSVTVNREVGDGRLDNEVRGPADSNCTDASAGAECRAEVNVQALEITKTADTATVVPGGTVVYTVTIANTGTVDYTAATVADDLTAVLDDAVYNGDAAADTGAFAFAAPVLEWTGGIAAGATVVLTYSVTANDPPSGDGTLGNAVTGPEGSNCQAASTDPGCSAAVKLQALAIVKESATGPFGIGDTVAYTITLTNTGQVDYTATTVADDLSEVIDDAVYNGDGVADAGSVSYAAPVLTWTGDIPVGATVTITYSVTVSDAVTGDAVLDNAVTGPPGSDCAPGSTDPDCSDRQELSAIEVRKSADTDSAIAGDTVAYTITVVNTGATDYSGTLTDDLSGAIDDAAYNEDADVDTGAVAYAEPVLTWELQLTAGASATLTYSVTVDQPFTGDAVLDNAVAATGDWSNCGADSTDADCITRVPLAALDIEKTAATAAAGPGDTVAYTITIANTGQAAYIGATVTDDLTAVLDDAVYNGDAGADAGTMSYSAPVLTWTGDLEPGATATITYTVTLDDPVTGDHRLMNAVAGPDGSDCEPGSIEAGCSTDVPIAGLRIEKSNDADPTAPLVPGGTIVYTVTVANTGQVDHTGITVSDDLTEVLDDAAYNGDAEADAGTMSYSAPVLTWTGDVPVGSTVTITYSVTVDDPDTGDKRLVNAVIGPDGSNCDDEAGACVNVLPESELDIAKTAAPGEVEPGATVEYTITVTNTGRGVYPGALITDDLTAVLDDAVYNDDASDNGAGGTLAYDEPVLTWTGDIAAGATVAITYSVTVGNPFPAGDGELDNTVTGPRGSDCEPGAGDEDCSANARTRVYDFGDAPDRYRTTSAEGGPFHRIVETLRLGDAIESKSDGTPSDFADADDDDDSVVAARGVEYGSHSVQLDVNAYNDSDTAAVLAGWIDLDADGRFEPEESVRAAVPAGTGHAQYTLTWDTAALDAGQGLTASDLYLRLRLFGESGSARAEDAAEALEAAPVGFGGAGEVEDYYTHLDPPAPSPGPDGPDHSGGLPSTGDRLSGAAGFGGLALALGIGAYLGARLIPRRGES